MERVLSENFAEFLLEFFHVFKFSVHGREANVGNFINPRECAHHILADGRAAHFPHGRPPRFLERIEHVIDVFAAHRTLGASNPNAPLELAAAIRLPRAVSLDDDEGRKLLTFKGGESVVAGGALSPSSHGSAFFGKARIYHGGVLRFASWAVHGGMIGKGLVEEKNTERATA